MSDPNPQYQPYQRSPWPPAPQASAPPVSPYPIPPYALPRKKRPRWPWIVGGSILAALLLCGIGSIFMLGSIAKDVDDQIQHGSAEKKAAVKISHCGPGAIGTEITYEVTNSTGRSQSYWAVFEVQDRAGTRLGEAHGIVNDLGPGQTATDTTTAMTKGAAAARCVVVRVD